MTSHTSSWYSTILRLLMGGVGTSFNSAVAASVAKGSVGIFATGTFGSPCPCPDEEDDDEDDDEPAVAAVLVVGVNLTFPSLSCRSAADLSVEPAQEEEDDEEVDEVVDAEPEGTPELFGLLLLLTRSFKLSAAAPSACSALNISFTV